MSSSPKERRNNSKDSPTLKHSSCNWRYCVLGKRKQALALTLFALSKPGPAFWMSFIPSPKSSQCKESEGIFNPVIRKLAPLAIAVMASSFSPQYCFSLSEFINRLNQAWLYVPTQKASSLPYVV